MNYGSTSRQQQQHAGAAGLFWKKLSVSVGDKQLLSNVSGSARRGRLLAVMGASGAGKSTLLTALVGMLGPKVTQLFAPLFLDIKYSDCG